MRDRRSSALMGALVMVAKLLASSIVERATFVEVPVVTSTLTPIVRAMVASGRRLP